jgi:hypothetical protein
LSGVTKGYFFIYPNTIKKKKKKKLLLLYCSCKIDVTFKIYY